MRFDPPPFTPMRMAIIAIAVLLPVAASCADFSGQWQSATTVRSRNELEGSTTLRLRQFGSLVCGEWSEGVGSGKLLGGNLTGRVDGHRMQVNIGEDIYWAKSGRYPNQRHERALFALQGRELAWYVRDDNGRLLKQQVFKRVEADAGSQADQSFTDPHFNRLCPGGTDFVTAR
jgi:hypothetical protein